VKSFQYWELLDSVAADFAVAVVEMAAAVLAVVC
jgi:hypothetical protein